MERHFTEQQVSEIIRRAAERQSRSDTPGPAPSGISESELRRVASELGIDEDALLHAMGEVGASAVTDTGTLESYERTLERTIDGELPEESVALVMEEFMPVSGMSGGAVTIGRAVNYNAMVGMGQCNVNVLPRNGKTVLRVKSQAVLAAIFTCLPACITSLIGFTATARAGAGFPLLAMVVVGVWSVAIWAYRTLVRHTNGKVLELTERAAARLEDAAGDLRSRLGQPQAQDAPSEQSLNT